jgi:hypothetical protein
MYNWLEENAIDVKLTFKFTWLISGFSKRIYSRAIAWSDRRAGEDILQFRPLDLFGI